MKILSFLVAIGVGLGIYIFTLLIRNTILPRVPITETPQIFGIPYSGVSFFSTDGFQLKGWFIWRDAEVPTIILCHGLGTNRADPLSFAKILYEGGWNLLMFDFRGHGESQQKVTSFGYLEQRDLAGAIEYLENRQDLKNHRYGIFGISMGAAVAILEGARNPKLQAIAVDSCFVSLSKAMGRYMHLLYNLPEWPFGRLASWAWQVRFFTAIQQVSPLDQIAKISPRPILILHGEKDDRIPVLDAQQLFERAGQPKAIWVTPGAGHLESYSIAPELYREKLLQFFQRSLSINAPSTAS